MKVLVATELAREVFPISIIKQDDTNILIQATSFIDAVTDIVGFAGSSKTGSRWLFLFEALEPLFSTNYENVFRVQRTVAAPFVPTFIWTSRISVEKESIEDHVDIAIAEAFAELANTLALVVIGLAVAEEYLRHEESFFNCPMIDSPGWARS
ncbi:MAG TPA: hypothetical protein VF290_02915 [Pyrinomonadaceae bacterium]